MRSNAANNPLAALAHAARRWLAYRDTSDALSRLSRRELSDIGVETSVDDYAWKISTDTTGR